MPFKTALAAAFWAWVAFILAGCSNKPMGEDICCNNGIKFRGAEDASSALEQHCKYGIRSEGVHEFLGLDDAGVALSSGHRRNVILIIGDGMQLAHEVAASRYLHGTDRALSFHAFPYQGFVTTWDVTSYNRWARLLGEPRYSPESFNPRIGYDPNRGGDAPYPLLPDTTERVEYEYFFPLNKDGDVVHVATDSASSATAMATGVKTDTGNIAWRSRDLADGALDTSALRLRRELGMAIGIATTGPISHATPASFISHNVHRENYHEISEEILLVNRPEVVIGAGHPVSRSGKIDFHFISQQAYEGVFASTDYVSVERKNGTDGSEALRAAAVMAANERKKLFGLFGRVRFGTGKVAHSPGTPTVPCGSCDVPSLADAALAALTVLSIAPDGFFLLIEQGDIDWANHRNQYNDMIAAVLDLDRAVQAVVDFIDVPGDAIDWSNTTVIVTADHANSYMRFGPIPMGRGELPGEPESDYVTYATDKHTNELVTLYARGVGSELFRRHANVYAGKPLVDNTSIFAVTMGAAQAY